ncbi:MAG: DUF6768 family protein [Hyphomonadaceae bacterium]
MTSIDQAIRQALSAEDAEFLARFESESPIQEALGTFSGKWGAMNIFAAVLTFALFGVFVFCVWNLLGTDDVHAGQLWAVGAVVSMLSVAMLKMYFWMEMNKNVMLREVKRLELQVARLAAKNQH